MEWVVCQHCFDVFNSIKEQKDHNCPSSPNTTSDFKIFHDEKSLRDFIKSNRGGGAT